MQRLICLLLLTLALGVSSVSAQDETCHNGKAKMPMQGDVLAVANVSPCGWLVTFKATARRQDFRIRGINGSPDVALFPPGTTCRRWYDWGGVWTIAVDDTNCTVYIHTIEGAWFAAKIRRLKR